MAKEMNGNDIWSSSWRCYIVIVSLLVQFGCLVDAANSRKIDRDCNNLFTTTTATSGTTGTNAIQQVRRQAGSVKDIGTVTWKDRPVTIVSMAYEVLASKDLYALFVEPGGVQNPDPAQVRPVLGKVNLGNKSVRRIGRTKVPGLNCLTRNAQGTLYAHSLQDRALYEIDPATGAAATAVFVTGRNNIVDIAYSNNEGLIYAVNQSGGLFAWDVRLKREVAHLGRIGGLEEDGVNIAGIAFSSHEGILYGITNEATRARVAAIDYGGSRPMFNAAESVATALAGPPVAGLSLKCKSKRPRYNVLMLSVDDLNDWVGHLGGHPLSYTPNIDRLAEQSLMFRNAHAPSSACLPSRAAILKGAHPLTSGVYGTSLDWQTAMANYTNVFKHFQNHGYEVLGTGKLFHKQGHAWPGYAPEDGWNWYVDPDDGDEFQLNEIPSDCDGGGGGGALPPCTRGDLLCDKFGFGPTNRCLYSRPDYLRASWTMERLREERKQPFFLAMGTTKPHLPWFTPAEYFERFPLEDIVVPETKEDDWDDLSRAAIVVAKSGAGHTIHEQLLGLDLWKEAVQAYLATISFADDMVGRVLDELAQSDYADNTVVVLWSDHGFHLGEKQRWKKFTLWEDCTHVPLMFKVPGKTENLAPREECIDLMTIYPTLVGLAGIQEPPGGIPDGYSVADLILNPNSNDPSPAQDFPPAITSYDQNTALRYEHWRYIHYFADNSEELYRHDVDEKEWNNLINEPEYTDILEQLRSMVPKNPAAPVTK